MHSASSLYDVLGQEVSSAANDRGRTERTAQVETIDRDRALIDLLARPDTLSGQRATSAVISGGLAHVRVAPDRVDLYLALGTPAGSPVSPGRTEGTKSVETVDRDRSGIDALISLSRPVRSDRGRTGITHATESLDWDRPPDR
jgi:hypothetical protein